MKKVILIAGVLWLCLGAGCREHVRSAELSVTSEDAAFIMAAEELGREIYMHDRYAAVATDLLLSHGVDLAGAGTLGWITESRQDGCAVTYVTGDPEQWRSVCVVTFSEHEDPNIILVDRDLTGTQSAMFNARQLALAGIEKPCSDAYNTVVIPRAGEPGWLVYALAATSDPNLILVGGHHRATVSADGRTVLDRRDFSRSCLALPKSPKDIPPGAELAAYTVSHLLDNTPTEIHVFLNLLHGKPFYVATPDRRLWYIENGKVQLLKRR